MGRTRVPTHQVRRRQNAKPPTAEPWRVSCSCWMTRTVYGEMTALDVSLRHQRRCPVRGMTELERV